MAGSRVDGVAIYFCDVLTTHLQYTTSLRDALLYHQLVLPAESTQRTQKNAIFRQIERLKEQRLRLQLQQHTIQSMSLADNSQRHSVAVLAVVSPHELFVRLESDNERFAALQQRLQKHYGDESATVAPEIWHPRKHMLCAVRPDQQWQRARIIHVPTTTDSSPERRQVRVWLIDRARAHTVSANRLYELHPQFGADADTVLACRLSGVEPLDSRDGTWPAEPSDLLRQLTERDGVVMVVERATAAGGHQSQRRHEVALYNQSPDGRLFNVKAVLVRRGLAFGSSDCDAVNEETMAIAASAGASTGDDVGHADVPDAELYDARRKVRLLHVQSPSEFYLMPVSRTAGLQTMHEEIQQHMLDRQQTDTGAAEDGWTPLAQRSCLVFVDGLWHRGICKGQLGDQYVVEQRDRGQTCVVSDVRHLARMPIRFGLVQSAAQRCCLACIMPTNQQAQWSSSAVDKFRLMCAQYAAIAASVQWPTTSRDKANRTLPVIMWGQLSERCDPLAGTVFRWVNINQLMTVSGLAHLTERFKPLQTNRLAARDQLLPNTEDDGVVGDNEEGGIDDGDYDQLFAATADLSVAIDQPPATLASSVAISAQPAIDVIAYDAHVVWLPPVPITRTQFVGIVTYVDSAAVIHLHESDQSPIVERIKSTLNGVGKRALDDFGGWRARIGDACVARFHLDGLLYRAVVLAVDKGHATSMVRFVDYGNVEECPWLELRPPELLDVPVQAQRYCLAGLRPLLTDSWPTGTLDYMHAQLVGKVSNISTCTSWQPSDTSDAVPCRVVADSVDVRQLLLENKLACITYKNSERMPANGKRPPLQPKVAKTADIAGAGAGAVAVDPDVEMTYDQYKAFFEAQDEKQMLALPAKDESDADVSMSFKNPAMYEAIPLSSSDEDAAAPYATDGGSCSSNSSILSFQPDETSTQIDMPIGGDGSHPCMTSSRHWSTRPPFTDHFRFVAPGTDTAPFTGCAVELIDAINVWVEPLYCASMQARRNQMAKRIALCPRTPIAAEAVHTGLRCLAEFDEDKKLYRAMVRSYDAVLDEATIVYVDYMNCVLMPSDRLVQYPAAGLDEFALEVMRMRVHGVHRNRRYRESDVERRMRELLQGVQFEVQVLAMGADGVPEVRLVRPETGGLVYQQLLDERYLVAGGQRP